MGYAFALLILTAPLYVWRFSIGGLPTNFLMLANFVAIGVGVIQLLREQSRRDLAQNERSERDERGFAKLYKSITSLGKPWLVSIAAFSLASVVSLFAFGIDAEKLGQWIVLYAQPLAIFFLIRYFTFTESVTEADAAPLSKVAEYCRIAAYVVVGAAGALAIIQYFTLFTLPPEWWGNANEPKRAIAFFAHANAFGLFVTPLLAWLVPHAAQKLRDRNYWYGLAWLVGSAGVLLSLSRGAWLGLVLAAGAYVLISANKKMLIGFAVAGLLFAGVVAAVPNLRYRVMLPFYGEKSAVARLSLWQTGWDMVADSPILGKGIKGFTNNWEAYNKDANLKPYNSPHNIVLNFWVDLGLLGLLSFIVILILAAVRGITHRQNIAALGMLLFIIAMVSHGLIDTPYLKNDLALVFWIALALSFQNQSTESVSQSQSGNQAQSTVQAGVIA